MIIVDDLHTVDNIYSLYLSYRMLSCFCIFNIRIFFLNVGNCGGSVSAYKYPAILNDILGENIMHDKIKREIV